MSDEPDAQKAATAVADAVTARGERRWLRPVLIAVTAIGLALLLGWIFAGLPGIGAWGSVSLVLLVVGGISGGLTLVFVVNAIRKTRHRKRLSLGEMLAVVVSSLITGTISTVQLVQTALQLVQR